MSSLVIINDVLLMSLPQLGEVGGGCKCCHHDRCTPRMITGHGVLLLETGLVLLVDDDEAKPLERQEDGTTGTQYDVVGMAR